MPVPQHIDRKTFLTHLRQSGLVSAEQLTAVKDRLPDTDRGRVVARTLVELGLLTKFQAERLLAGLTNGFQLGQYLILDQLGQGGMGRVFKAEHRTMNRIVALKVLAPNLLKTDKAQEMFQREVRAVARLMHPNIVTAYDANHVGERYYLVLEYVDGPNLEQLVRERGPLPVGQACEFIRQIAEGLHYAFEMGMVHRDIKPANILVQRPGPDGRSRPGMVKISDFGLARLHDPRSEAEGGVGTIMTKLNTVMGTPDYLSPEQARNLHKADIRSDLYSLGCTFYYLLTGQVPHPGGTTLEKLVRHSTEEPTAIEKLCPEVPAAVAAIVRQLMAKYPAERFQTPGELAAALAPFAVSGPTPWVIPPSGGPFSSSRTTPAASQTPVPVPHGDPLATDDESVLLGTLPPNLSPTPLSVAGMSSTSRLSPALAQEQKRRFKLALFWTVGIVGGLVAAAALVSRWL